MKNLHPSPASWCIPLKEEYLIGTATTIRVVLQAENLTYACHHVYALLYMSADSIIQKFLGSTGIRIEVENE